MPLSSDYLALTKQNWGFVAAPQQERLAGVRVLLAGCGLGSNIAVLAARSGFTRFTLCDGDKVEHSNLNRQAFRKNQLGQNKAEATATLVKEINPDADVVTFPKFILPGDAASLVQTAELIVNLVDPGPALIALLRAAQAEKKYTFFPLNVGFGALLFTFGPESPSIEKLMGESLGDNLFIGMLQKLMLGLPPYLLQHLDIAEKVGREGVPPPQLGVAASISASLVVTGMIGTLTGNPPPLVPEIGTLDGRAPGRITWPQS